MKIKIQETWYEMREDHVKILHEIASNFQDYFWTRSSLDDTLRKLRECRENNIPTCLSCGKSITENERRNGVCTPCNDQVTEKIVSPTHSPTSPRKGGSV